MEYDWDGLFDFGYHNICLNNFHFLNLIDFDDGIYFLFHENVNI